VTFDLHKAETILQCILLRLRGSD